MISITNPSKIRVLQFMYSLNILAAGIPGFIIVFFPSLAEQYVLWPGQDMGVMTILGSIWLAIGLASIGGLYRPVYCLPIFFIQFIYKSLWLSTFAIPQILAGQPIPPAMWFLVWIFAFLILEVILAGIYLVASREQPNPDASQLKVDY